MSTFASKFKAGSDIAGDLLNTYELAKRKKAMAEIAGAQETPAYTPDQGAELDALASARDAEGKPYYTLGNDASGKYTVAPNFQNETGTEPAAYTPSTMAAKGVSYLGKNYDAPLTEDQATGARQQAMAGVLERGGDLEGAMRYRQQAQQGVLTGLQLNQAKRTGLREDRADAVTATLEGVDKEAGDWMKSRLKNSDGTERVATVDDHLATTQFRANKLMVAGRANEAGGLMKDFNAQALIKIQMETAQRTEALKKTSAALAAGDLNAVKDFYNQFTPDGAQVVSVTRDGAGRINIERTTDDGRKMPPYTLKDTGELSAALNSFSDPMALYNWSQNEFRNNMALKADARAGQSLGIQQAQLGISQDERADKKTEKAAMADAGVALYQEQNPGATAAQLDAVRKGVMSAIPKESKQTPEGLNTTVNAMNTLIAKHTGIDTPRGATPEARAAWQKTLDTAVNLRDRAVAQLELGMAGREAKNSAVTPPPGRSASGKVTTEMRFKDQSEADAAVKAGKLKPGDRITINGVSGTWK